jgi:hypothetical protein
MGTEWEDVLEGDVVALGQSSRGVVVCSFSGRHSSVAFQSSQVRSNAPFETSPLL